MARLLVSLCILSLLSYAVANGSVKIKGLFEKLEEERAPASIQEAAARAVLQRLLPSHSSCFHFEVSSDIGCDDNACFFIDNADRMVDGGAEIIIKGSTAVELSAGLYWYLKYWCGAHISWDKTGGVQLFSIPSKGSLPAIQTGGVTIQRATPFTYYQNVVTSSYSFVWWEWERWEKEIDWMALQGVNLPLAFTGQEAIWQKVFQKFNLSKFDLDDFFGGPAFLAWARMGNLHAWGGPLPQRWIQKQLVLQKRILSRMWELGMAAVLPAFSGNVPAALKKKYPSAKITQLDADFWKPAQMKALLHSVPPGKMMVLDLYADVKPIWQRSNHFYGTPYIWCMLHNFGGNIEMYGTLDAIASGPVDAHRSPNSTMVGIGMCMEGIEQNPVVYDLMPEMAFQKEKVNIEDHNKDFIVNFPDVDPSSTVSYVIRNNSSLMARKLLLSELSSVSSQQPHLWYSTSKALEALQLFLNSSDKLSDSLTYRYDLIDLTRQALAKLANKFYIEALVAFSKNNIKEVTAKSQTFLNIIIDLDILLASDDNFLLGPWLQSAKNLADNLEEKKQYEWNARTQITMWYDNTEVKQSKLHDYANKYWSGLLRNYYQVRATIYFNLMLESMKENVTFPLDAWRREWIKFSNNWQQSTELYPLKAEGDALHISNALFRKYFFGSFI